MHLGGAALTQLYQRVLEASGVDLESERRAGRGAGDREGN